MAAAGPGPIPPELQGFSAWRRAAPLEAIRRAAGTLEPGTLANEVHRQIAQADEDIAALARKWGRTREVPSRAAVARRDIPCIRCRGLIPRGELYLPQYNKKSGWHLGCAPRAKAKAPRCESANTQRRHC